MLVAERHIIKKGHRFWEKEKITQKHENEGFETNVVPNWFYLFMTLASFLYYFTPQICPLKSWSFKVLQIYDKFRKF